ncbi:hypothetical protein POVWA2_023900 [Plasmodium ovale wallikeri]|uniref:PIR Superfamily Protein n=1 Tax=Plasmodium ovale wallikeri TaxID=864142 RepID=A0A1A8YUT9_PLAOA|nr:hypothetical protein POVWA1_024010 [Plasmodium ovale wallikeri]SBT35212.1 hypothetical protein POVWA2_023900 [Plasmodium ovale wallikeri]
MKINSGKFKKSSEKCRKCISQQRNGKSGVLFLNNNDSYTETDKGLNKCSNNTIQDNLQYSLLALTVNICNRKAISKFSVLVRLYPVFIKQLILSHAIIQTICFVCANDGDSQADSSASGSSSGIVDFFTRSFSCFKNAEDTGCIQKMFLILSLFGTFLSLIGGVLSLLYRFCSCFMCCRRKPRQRPGNEANNSNKQLELMKMQMQMQQQQMCNALMGAALKKKGEHNMGKKKGGKKKKKNNDSSNVEKTPRKRNSKDDTIHLGYQKEEE